jgi:crotonobetainyl-CoA:carnitine CoA-transferase CaiB-like acyl-CoA transferase
LPVFPVVDGFFAGLCDSCGHPEWKDDARFAQLADRRRHMRAFADLVAAAVATMTTADALARFRAADVAVGEVYEPGAVEDHPQVRWNGTVVRRHDPLLGAVRVPRHAPRFWRTPAEPPGDVPALGQHTAAVLAELGLDGERVDGLFAAGVVAGPRPG